MTASVEQINKRAEAMKRAGYSEYEIDETLGGICIETDADPIKYAIEWHAPRAAGLYDLDSVVWKWVSTGWIESGSPAETNFELAEVRLAEAQQQNPGSHYRIVPKT